MSDFSLDCQIGPDEATQRIDTYIADRLNISRGRIHQAIAGGSVQINNRPVRKSYILRLGDRLSAEVAADIELRADETPHPLPVVFSDDDVIVVDKPVGVAAHAANGWSGPTVLGALLAAGWTIDTEGDQYRRGIVHRLDVATSGLMVIARNEDAFESLKLAFKERKVTKIYHALVQGHMPHEYGTIDAPIGRSKGKDFRMGIRDDGKSAITHYRVLEKQSETELLEVRLETGRTHQIRVHCAALQRPCVGDKQYGANPRLSKVLGAQRQWLHAKELAFAHPRSGKSLQFFSDYPQDLSKVLEKARILGEPTRAMKAKPE